MRFYQGKYTKMTRRINKNHDIELGYNLPQNNATETTVHRWVVIVYCD